MKKWLGLSLAAVAAPVLTIMYYSGLFLSKNETVVKEVESEEPKLVGSIPESVEVVAEEVQVPEKMETSSLKEQLSSKPSKKPEDTSTWKNTANSTKEETKAKSEKAPKNKQQQKPQQSKTTKGYSSNVQEENYRAYNHPTYRN